MTFAQSPERWDRCWIDPNSRSFFGLITGFSRLPEHCAQTLATAITLLWLQVRVSCVHFTPWLVCKLPRGRAKSRQLRQAQPVPSTGIVMYVYGASSVVCSFGRLFLPSEHDIEGERQRSSFSSGEQGEWTLQAHDSSLQWGHGGAVLAT